MWLEPYKDKFRAIERYTDPMTGKQKRVSTIINKDTKQARKAAEDVLRAKIEATMTEKSDSYTLKNVLDSYIAYQKENGTQDNTVKRNKSVCDHMVALLGCDVLVNQLNARYITDKLIRSGLANSTKNNYMIRFRAMMRWAYKHDYIEDIKFLDKIDRFQEQSTRTKIADKFLESKEVVTLLEGLKTERWKLFTHFLVLTGLRVGEAIALDDSDLTDVISVTKTMDITTGKRKDRTKTDSSTREVYIQPELSELVKNIRHFVRLESLRVGYRTKLFFPGINGDYIQYAAYEKYLKENSEAILNRRITPHTLRHTHVSLLAEQGYPLEAISRRVGHEDSRITKAIYLHITEKQKEKDNEQLRNIKIL